MKLVGVWHTRANNNYNIENVALILLEGDKRLSTYKKKPKELFTKELEINYSSVKSYLIYRGYYFSDIERLADQEELPNEREHFARQCPNNPNLVRFFPTLTHAIQNKYVDIKPGRYYADHFGIDPAVASATWRKLFVSSDLLFATTTKEIEEVYTTGPSSCMAHSRTEYRYNDGKHHPTAVYGDGSDLAVAYTKRYGKINSRAVCWPEKKIYNRLYGDVEILRDLLHKAGYKPGHFYGAKLARLPYKLGFVMPYIDNHSCVRDDETHLTIVEEPTPIPARSQYGAVAMGVECQYYGGLHRGTNLTSVLVDKNGGYQQWCEEAVQLFAFTCEMSSNVVDKRVGVKYKDKLVSPAWARRNLHVCHGNGSYVSSSEMVTLKGKTYSKEYISELLKSQANREAA